MQNLNLACIFALNSMTPAFAAGSGKGGKRTVRGAAKNLQQQECWEALTATTQLWQNYKCNNCGSTASAAPNAKDEVICSCGTHHTNEPFFQPQTRKRAGVTEVLNAVHKKGNEVNLTHFKAKCPSEGCGVSNFFTTRDLHVRQECATCGTDIGGADRLVKIDGVAHYFSVPARPGADMDNKRADNEAARHMKGEMIREIVEATGATVEQAEQMLLDSAQKFVEEVARIEGRELEAAPIINILENARTGAGAQTETRPLTSNKKARIKGSGKEPVFTPMVPAAVSKLVAQAPDWIKQHRRIVIGALSALGLGAAAFTYLYGNSPVMYRGEVTHVSDLATGGQKIDVEFGGPEVEVTEFGSVGKISEAKGGYTYYLTFETNAATESHYIPGDNLIVHGHRWFPGRAVIMGDNEYFVVK